MITHHKPRGMHVPAKVYTAQQQAMNDFACRVCGIKSISEAEWIEADLANSHNKTERHDAQALTDQINYLDKMECD